MQYKTNERKEVLGVMKRKPLYTNLTIEECENFFITKITLKNNQSIISYGPEKYIGEFHGNEFYIATEIAHSFFWDDTCSVLQGRIIHSRCKTKNKIEYKFGISYTFMINWIIGVLLVPLLFMNWWGDIERYMELFFKFSMFAVITIIMLSFTLYRIKHNVMLVYVKEMFQCEDNE